MYKKNSLLKYENKASGPESITLSFSDVEYMFL